MDADLLKQAFKLASGVAKEYKGGLEFHGDNFNLIIKPLISKTAPKLKVIFKF